MTFPEIDLLKGVRILCALALVLVGFTHKVPALDEVSSQSVELSQYVFPDGTPQVLCLSGKTVDGEYGGLGFTSGCKACRLIGSLLLPVPQDMSGWVIRLPADRFVPLRATKIHRPILQPNAAPRGPPSGLNVGAIAAAAATTSARAG